MNDYKLSGSNHYGDPDELGNNTQEMTLKQDRSFTFTIDRKSHDDTQMAKELWDKFKKLWGENRKVKFLLFIASKAKELWAKFKESWGDSKVAKFFLRIGSTVKELWENFKEKWGESRTVNFFLKIASRIKELWDDFKTSWGEKRSVSFLTKNSKATTAGKVWSIFKTAWGSKSVNIGIGFAKTLYLVCGKI